MAKTVIRLPARNWKPRPYQTNAWRSFENGGKRACLVWHRRAGKDDVALNRAAVATHERIGNYWHMLPQASQARKAIWEAVNPHTGIRRIDEAFPEALRETTRENEMMIRFKCGSTWQVIGSDNFDSLVGSPPLGVVFSEWSLARPASWDYIRPILAENGGWAVFIFTPRGRNHGWDILKVARDNPADWFSEVLTAEETKAIPPDILATELKELQSQHGDEQGRSIFEQEYYCSFNAYKIGAYYASLLDKADKEGRISGVPYDPGLRVYTAWDLGRRDATAIWFAQQVGLQIRIIDYYEAAGHDLAHYVKVLREKPYVYEDNYLPHDVSHELLGMPKTRAEQLESMGLSVVAGKALAVEDGINAVRRLIPQCWFDRTKCARGLEALRAYHAEWDDDLRTFRGRAVHDWSSHGADAFRELAVNLDVRPAKSGWNQPATTKWIV